MSEQSDDPDRSVGAIPPFFVTVGKAYFGSRSLGEGWRSNSIDLVNTG